MNSLQIHSRTCVFNNDLLTPMAAYLKLNQADAFFLESVEKGQSIGRYSMIGLDPLIRVQGYKDYLGMTQNENTTIHEGEPMDQLNDLYKKIQHQHVGDCPIAMGFLATFRGKLFKSSKT